MSPSEILSTLDVKGVSSTAGPEFADYLLKAGVDGTIDTGFLPFAMTSGLYATYFIDSVLGDDDTGSGSIISPFKTIAKAIAFNATAGGTRMILVLGQGTYDGAITVANVNQVETTFLSLSPLGALVSSQITHGSSATSCIFNLIGVKATGGVHNANSGAIFHVNLMTGATANNVTSHGSATAGTLTIYPGSSAAAASNMNPAYVVNADESNYTPATSGDWAVVPTKVDAALDAVASILKDNVMKLDGTSSFKDGITQLFKIRRSGFITTVGYVTPAADATVAVPNRTGTLPVVDDVAGHIGTDATWSIDNLKAMLVLKAGDTMTGPLVLSNSVTGNVGELQFTNGATYRVSLKSASLTGNRTITLPDIADEITVQSNTFNVASRLVKLSADSTPKLPAVDGSLLVNMVKTQVGLGNVTNDAQLKRADNDWTTFTVKAVPVGTDQIIMEEATTGAKKTAALSTISGWGGEANTASNLGVSGEGLYASKSGVDLRFKKLVQGNNVSLTADANSITIATTIPDMSWHKQTCTDNTITSIAVGDLLTDRGLDIWLIFKAGTAYRSYKYQILSNGITPVDNSGGSYFDNGTFPGTVTLATSLVGNDICAVVTLAGIGVDVEVSWQSLKSPITI